MKKSFIIISGLVLILAATSCNRKAFEKKLVGSWSLNKYLYSGKDETALHRDTTMNAYDLTISEGQTYSEYWQSLTFRADTLILSDTLSFDTLNSAYLIKFDTVPVVDTTFAYHQSNGRWDLLNSESDLQLKDDATNAVRVCRILTLDASTLNLRNGNEELYLKK